MKPDLFVGIDLGGTKIFTGLVDGAGVVLAQDYRKTKARRGPEFVVERLIASAREVLAVGGVTAGEVRAVGIGAPGPVNPAAGMVIAPPNLPGWECIPLQSLVEEALGIPTSLENDANAAALGEHRFGAGRGSQHMLYITVSTGIGGGIILDGELYRGASGMAGEVGHMTVIADGPQCGCGNLGCLEAVASGTAIAREGRELMEHGKFAALTALTDGDPELVTAKLVAEAAAQGDAKAQEIIRDAMRYLGIGVANLVNLLNPELVVVGGSLTKLGETLFGAVDQALKQRAFPLAANSVRVVPAELGDRAGLLGAAAVAMLAVNRGAEQ